MPEPAGPAPLSITLYNPETNEVTATYSRLFVPWKILKAAVRMAGSLDASHMTDTDMDALAALVVEAFGNKFSIQDLNDGADVGEMVTVLNTIIAKARGAMPANPTPPGIP